MPGRRWGEGMHQAIEAKEGVAIQAESQTLASTTFQNYFRLYEKLAGMTGTADTEAFEFQQIYGLDVVVIPTNKDIQRIDHNDLVYLTEEEKFQAIIDEIKDVIVCPICLAEKNVAQTIAVKYKNNVIPFCRCPHCISTFEEKPEYYLDRLTGKVEYDGLFNNLCC